MTELELIRLQEITRQYVEARLVFYSNCVVYGLIDPTTHVIRYIGITINGVENRYKAHVYNAAKTTSSKHVTRWIRKLLHAGLKPDVIVIEEHDTCDELNAAERRLIQELWSKGFPLTNGTEGGDLNRLTEGIRKQIGISQKIRMAKPGVREKMSTDAVIRCADLEVKEKFSKSQKKRFEREEELNKNRNAAKRLYSTPERKLEQVRKMNAGKATPEARVRYREGAKRRFERPEERALDSHRIKEYYSNPDNRQRLSETIKKMWENPEHREKYLKALAEGRSKPESKLNRSRGQKKRFENPEERLKCQEQMLQLWAQPEYRKHMSLMGKQNWQNPAYRASISQKIAVANTRRFADPESRNNSARGHGGKEFIAIDVKTQNIAYRGVSLSMCAQILGVVRTSIQRHLYKIRKNPIYKGYTFEFV